ncbi:uncharacterized protein [Procambarus clarkii]|uniref:uncharacterized protein n=1 Tax=Procambarus clarkii TaxID=6728 RepID=UPI001E67122C|nr:uncharacterized protein LOC123762122 [Procambarus clarkii]XP_045604425.1 uncharacterized protein LOC123762122 [Procambarus clarkii]
MSIAGDVRGISRRCHVPGCGASSPGVVVYSVRKSKDEEGHRRWMMVLGLDDVRLAVHACQRHFPAGAPTRNHPDPNPNLFNPIPNQVTQNGCSSITCGSNIPPIFNTSADGTPLGPNGQPLPAPVQPPPGSVTKLAPNATLIDLNKIKKDHDGDRPFRIEQVTVLIDETDDVKVVGYGPRDPLNVSPVERVPGRLGRPRKVQPPPPPMWDDGGATDGLEDVATEPSYHQFGDPSLGNALEQMRQLRIDCNTALVDMDKRQMVYAHRAVLVARSPYFYRQMYLRRKKLKYLYQFCRFTLPIDVNFDVVDAVVSYMYTGSMTTLWGKGTASIRKVLSLFEMKEALELYDQEVAGREVEEKEPRRARKRIKREHGEDNLENLVLPLLSETGETVDGTGGDEGFRGEERRRRRKAIDSDVGDDVHGKMKVSVQKIVDSALTPFLGKIEELFDPSASTLQIARTSQHIITLWHADILLTKLFDQNELTKFFSEVMNEVLEKNNLMHQQGRADGEGSGFNVEILVTHTGNPLIDEAYNKASIGDPVVQEVETITVGDMQIINYHQIDPQHISKYVHMIAMYRYRIRMGRKAVGRADAGSGGTGSSSKDTLMPPLLEGDVLPDDSSTPQDLDDLVNRIAGNGDELLSGPGSALTRACFQHVSIDLKRRAVSDLELYVNPSFHEELIMHIMVDQVEEQGILPLSLAVFLAKGCNFCRKKECKGEDLTLPISPDNPVCPDRQCIKRNLICEMCNKQMSNSKSLARHKYSLHDIQVGDTGGLFICSHCGETFSKKWKLNMHERQHEDRKLEVACQICGKVMRGAMALKKHVSMVHETRPQFQCDFCSKSFKRKETLNVHLRIHTGEKPFPCNRCEYASETKGNLKAHMWRKHKIQLGDPSTEQQLQAADEQAMAATLVAHAHTLADGSFIIAEGTAPSGTIIT